MNNLITLHAGRRQRLMTQLQPHSMVLVNANVEVLRTGDTHYPYRPNSDLYYLTGFQEPEALLVLMPGRAAGEAILFNRVKDPGREVWDGPRVGQAGACSEFGMAEAYPIGELATRLVDLLAEVENVYYLIGQDPALTQLLMTSVTELHTQVRRGKRPPTAYFDLQPILHEMRLIKDEAEIAVMRQSAAISARAHTRAMQTVKPGMFEYELEAELQYDFMRQGSRFTAYSSIVAGGANACVLHYVTNDQVLNDGDLVLIDAGGEYQCYASDISRTFPVNGKFSAPQRALYQGVLDAQIKLINMIKPGLKVDELQTASIRELTAVLVQLGILHGDVDQLVADQAYLPYYMHRVSHWLGMDTHDVGAYRIADQWRPLQAGMVLTIEPGLYIPPQAPVDPEWRGIGIRIEDDILVTTTGHEVLTSGVPKTIADIEALMAS